MRRDGFLHPPGHLGVGFDLFIDADQFVAHVGDLAAIHGQVEPADERAVATRLDDRRAAHPGRAVQPVVGVAADQRVDARHFGGELGVLRETEVRQHQHQVDLLAVAQAFDVARQFAVAEREAHPFGKARRHGLVDDVRGDADDADAQAAALDHATRREDELPRRLVVDVDRQRRVRQPGSELAHLRRSVGELPVQRHRVECERVHQRQQCFPARLHGDVSAVEGVAVVQRQHFAGTLGAHPLEDAGDARQAAAGAVVEPARGRGTPRGAVRGSRADRSSAGC